MGWIRSHAFLLVLLFLMQIIPTFGEEEVNRGKKIDPKSTIVQRSSLHARFLSRICVPQAPTGQGFWIKKLVWGPRWVKAWEAKQKYLAVWKKVWGPTLVKKWVPVQKLSCGWVEHTANNFIVYGY